MIGFDYTSPIDTNGLACIYMDNNYNYSPMKKLNTGDRAIDRLSEILIDGVITVGYNENIMSHVKFGYLECMGKYQLMEVG